MAILVAWSTDARHTTAELSLATTDTSVVLGRAMIDIVERLRRMGTPAEHPPYPEAESGVRKSGTSD